MTVLATVRDVFNDRAAFEFMGHRRRWLLASAIAVALSVGGWAWRGLNLGIDFEGGTAWEVTTSADVDPAAGEVRDVLRSLGLADARVSILGGESLRVQARIADEPEEREKRGREVSAALARYAGVDEADVGFTEVGPTFGEEVAEKAVRALLFFLLAVSAYLAFRFEWRMALAALVALFHDVLITVGVYSLTGFEVTPATVVAILTILGYSLYDTVVVFDKVSENAGTLGTSGRVTYSDVVNRSLNEVLMRSLNTSFTTLVPVTSLLVVASYILGAVTIRDFALALFVGLLVGTYSSIFTAAPVLAVLKERQPRFRQIRRRLESRAAAEGVAAEVPEELEAAERSLEEEGVAREVEAASRLAAPALDTGVITARARQPRRRKRRR